jgi:predicted acylesterase/phospholipase RssA
MSQQPLGPPKPTLALALSGGGKRASLFALGALLAVSEAGLNGSTVAIASVSGGSITNAVVAVKCDFMRVEKEQFRSIAYELARVLQSKRHRVRAWWLLLLGAAYTVLAETSPVNRLWDHVDVIRESRAPESLVMLLLLSAGSLVAFSVRTLVQEQVLSALFRKPSGTESTLADLQGRRMSHIFCLTDLEEGVPLLFRNDRCLHLVSDKRTGERHCQVSQQHGLGLARVVTGSAAFPGAFAPAPLQLNDGLGQGLANWTVVADGGVYNNLATDWLLQGAGLSEVDWPDEWPAETGVVRDLADHVFVVDASAPPNARRIGVNTDGPFALWKEFTSLFRIAAIINASNVAHRQHLLDLADSHDGSPAVHRLPISEPATAAAEKYSSSSDPRISARASVALQTLLSLSSQREWDDLAAQAGSVRTTLGKLSHSDTRALMWHGYHSMATALRVHFGHAAAAPALPALHEPLPRGGRRRHGFCTGAR